VSGSDGEEPAPNPLWLRTEAGTVKVRAGAIGRARLLARIPREKRYAGRRWYFVAAVDARGAKGAARRWFVLHVRTPDWKEERGR
jgi:hypothetical protein